jgi:Rrf2 family protein
MSLFSNGSVHISAKTDYAIRATIELASTDSTGSLTAHAIAEAQQIPLRFLLNILTDLRRVGLVESRRGPNGGWWLSRPADAITVADVIRAVDGPLTEVVGSRSGRRKVDGGSATSVNDLWVTVGTGIREILEQTTIADLARGNSPLGKAL